MRVGCRSRVAFQGSEASEPPTTRYQLMAQSRFDRIAELFEAARALPADEWAPYLEAACPDGADLRDEILDMLIQKERAISWFQSPEHGLAVGARAAGMPPVPSERECIAPDHLAP